MRRYESIRGSKTVTIGELYLHIKACDLSAIVLDTVVASEFEVDIAYEYSQGDEFQPARALARSIKATANVQFAGDASNLEIKRGTDLMLMFTGAQVTALEDRLTAAIRAGESDDA